MNLFLVNFLLATMWAAIIGQFSLFNLGVGFVLGYLALLTARPALGDTQYFSKGPQFMTFASIFFREMIVASLRVLYAVIRPFHHSRPGVIGIPLEATTDLEITLLANVISLTPGTLSLDLSSDRTTLYIHAMFIDEPDALRREIKQNLERPLLELMR